MTPQPQGKARPAACACRGVTPKRILLYACSGAANVAEAADRAARQLMFAGVGNMACLAGIAAEIPAMVKAARDADLNVILEGCPTDCAKKIFDRAGLTNYVHVRVTDLGFKKIKGVRATDGQVSLLVARAKEVIAKT